MNPPVLSPRLRLLLDRAGAWSAAALIVVFFGLPLFRGLNNTEFRWDEPIYAFAVDRMIANGDWLTPRAIPSDTNPFLEKPPLKFWIVAGSIHAGLLPHTEAGQRFWDALFGVLVFLYVFAIGRLAGGSVCGLVAAFVLFVHRPLIFDHGLRSNSMEAALVLSYCAAMYHALAWSRATKPWQRRVHPLLVGAWFLLGFMTKFVAAVFLPAVLVLTALLLPAWRRRALSEWRIWLSAAALVAAGSVPWFVYETVGHGRQFWRIILGEHVFVRFTTFLDPAHLQPWHFYVTTMYDELAASQTHILVLVGLVILIYRTIRARWDVGTLLLLWFAVPLLAISFGTSKLYHYTYPFLPPLAVAAGMVPAVLLGRHAFFRPWLDRVNDRLGATKPVRWVQGAPAAVRWVLLGVAGVAFAVAVLTPFLGTVRLEVGGEVLLRNSTTIRPMLVAAVLLMLTGYRRLVIGALLIPLFALAMPIDPYGAVIDDLPTRRAPVRSMSQCLRKLQANGAPAGVFSHSTVTTNWEYWYYFGPIGYRAPRRFEDHVVASRLFTPEAQRPVQMHESDYAAYRDRLEAAPAGADAATRLEHMPRFTFDDGQMLLLPGPYGVCADIVTSERHGD